LVRGERERESFFLEPVLFIERPVGDRAHGLSEATLRIPAGHDNFLEPLFRAFTRLFAIYGNRGYFDVSVTANVVLEGRNEDTYSVFYGQDYSNVSREFAFDGPITIRRLAQVGQLPTQFALQDFEHVFFGNFEDTSVTVHSIICYVYLIRRYMSNYEQQRTTGDRKMQTLF
jgi:hypothetical protein